MWIDKYLKAIIGGLIAGLSLLAGFLSAPDATFQSITAGQWVGVAIAFLFGLTGVYATPNGMQPPKQTPIWVGTEADDEWLYEAQQPVNTTNTLRPEQGL